MGKDPSFLSLEMRLFRAGYWWLIPVILATEEVEIRRIVVQSQFRQIVHETPPSRKKPNTKNRVCGVAQGDGLELKLQYSKKKKAF
jgi:hypothetical protein